MNRDQYGDWEILDPAFTLARAECSYSNRWTENKSNPTASEELNFLWNYQIKEMYLRYFAWQFIGKEDNDNPNWELVTLGGDLIKKLRKLQLAWKLQKKILTIIKKIIRVQMPHLWAKL